MARYYYTTTIIYCGSSFVMVWAGKRLGNLFSIGRSPSIFIWHGSRKELEQILNNIDFDNCLGIYISTYYIVPTLRYSNCHMILPSYPQLQKMQKEISMKEGGGRVDNFFRSFPFHNALVQIRISKTIQIIWLVALY